MIPVLMFLLACGGPEPTVADDTPVVRSQAVAETTFADDLTLSGTLEAAQHAILFPEAQGRIAQVNVRIGDTVRKGDVLMTLNGAAYAAGVKQAEAAVAMAEAQAKQAADHAARMEGLAGQNAVTNVELETAQSNKLLTAAQLAQAEAALAGARQQYAGTRVKAPFSGVITARNVHPGDILGAATMGPPLQIADLTQLRLITSVSELVAGQVKSGIELKVRVGAIPGETFTATVERINAAVDPVTRTVQIEALVDNPQVLLKHGMSAEVSLSGVGQTAVAVPRTALLDRDDGTARVMILEGEQARARTIHYGRSQRDSVPVLDGLTAGERVLVAGHTRLQDGEAVRDVAQ